ncbi:MAG TPA: hypothetical protein VJ997_01170, partial [Longimicrobiales bacterium]|nr:hypothetical protein [Longimicrobiales bacterium]
MRRQHHHTVDLLRLLAVLLLLPAAAHAQEKPPLTLADYGAWSRITRVSLSPDGAWMAYTLQPNDGDATLRVKSLDGNAAYEGVNGSDAAFSDDGRWVAFLTAPPEEEADKLRQQRKPIPHTYHLVDLRSGEEQEDPGVVSFAFSDGGRFVAILRERADREAEHTGADFLLRDLQAGTVL